MVATFKCLLRNKQGLIRQGVWSKCKISIVQVHGGIIFFEVKNIWAPITE